jgi:L-alanine-DL-glutamate epimerase-like enolase superfamily enzyme
LMEIAIVTSLQQRVVLFRIMIDFNNQWTTASTTNYGNARNFQL